MNTIKSSYFLLFSFFFVGEIFAQQNHLNIIPEPLAIELKAGDFIIKKGCTISLQKDFSEAMPSVLFLQTLIKKESGIFPVINPVATAARQSKGNIHILKDEKITNEEEYYLTIDKSGIQIKASSQKGVFYAFQTLSQLIASSNTKSANIALPAVSIHDKPRFPFRALMLDPARHFLNVADLKKYIDAMSLYKYNALHLHLSDDQGWRVEIKSLPKLAEISAIRKEMDGDGKPHQGYYTQEQLKDIVKYAQERNIEIIPEIDVPGHNVAALAAYPELSCEQQSMQVSTIAGVSKELLCAGNEKVYEFYEKVIAELAEVFPSKKFHIGGDEAPLDKWKKCPRCQSQIQKQQLKDEHQLMGYFFKRIGTILEKYQKEPLIWYELDVPEYPQNSTMYLWRYGTAKKVIETTRKEGYKLIASPGEHAYFDYPQQENDLPNVDWMPLLTLKQVYDFDPTYGLPTEQSKHIIGVEACLWGESVKTIDRAFYMTFPRALAFSEAGWSEMKNRNWDDFKNKIPFHLNWLLNKAINYRPPVELY